MVPAGINQQHHQLVVRDAKLAEAAKTSARIHHEGQQFPAPRIQHVITGEACGIGLVHRQHHVRIDAREGFAATEEIIDERGPRGRIDINDVVRCAIGVPLAFAGMVVERGINAGNIGEVGGDIGRRDGDLAVLHVLGMDELDFADQIDFLQQRAADQPIHVTPGDQAELAGRAILQKLLFCDRMGFHGDRLSLARKLRLVRA